MSTHATAPERVFRILTIVVMLLMLAVPAMAAPQAAPAAPTSFTEINTVTLVSPTTAVPAYYPAGVAVNIPIKYNTDGSGTGEGYYQVGAVTGSTVPIGALPVAGGAFTAAFTAAQALAGGYDVQVCARAIGQIGWTCKTETNAVIFINGAPNTPQGPRWPISAETLIKPNKVGGIYDVLLNIQSPTPPNPTFQVTWDQALAAAVPNPAANPITLELWDTTNYDNVPPDCRPYTDFPANQPLSTYLNKMVLRWKSDPLPNTGSFDWSVPPTLGSCFMMRLVVTDVAGQTGWDWSGPLPSAPNTDPDPLSGRFQISAYDLWKPTVSLDGQKMQCVAPVAKTVPTAPVGAGGPYLGPFKVNAEDKESGIDWVFFQAKWAGGSGPAFPDLPSTPAALWNYLIYTNPAYTFPPAPPAGSTLYAGYIPTSTLTGLTAGTPFTVEVTARNMTGLTNTLSITNVVWADPAALKPFDFDESCSAKSWPGVVAATNPNQIRCISYLGGTKVISGTVEENFAGEVAGVDFYWQPIDTSVNPTVTVGISLSIGSGVRTPNTGFGKGTGGDLNKSKWTLTWDTTAFPDGPGVLIAVVKNCAGATIVTKQDVNNQGCQLVIFNKLPTCAADAIIAPKTGYDWQIGQGWQWPLPSVNPPYPLGGNENGLILWDPLKIQGTFPAPAWSYVGSPIPVGSAGAISNIEVSWDNGAHWFRILLDGTFWPNTPMYQTSLGTMAGYPWLYVHGRPNAQNTWRVRLTATDVAGNQCQTTSQMFSVFGREEQVGTGCGPTPPTGAGWPAALAPPIGSCLDIVPTLTLGLPLRATVPMTTTVWDPQTGISSVDFKYKNAAGAWVSIGTTDVPVKLQEKFSGPYDYKILVDTTTIPDGTTQFKSVSCNGVGICRDSTIVTAKVDNTAPVFANIWPRSYQTIVNVYCASFLPDPPTDVTNAIATGVNSYEFQYKRSADGGVTWSNWLPAGNAFNAPLTNSQCTTTNYYGQVPADDPTTVAVETLPDGTLLQVRGRISDTVGNVTGWMTHYNIKVDNQFPDEVQAITLNTGWNLISLPYPPAQPLIAPPEGVRDGVLKDLFDTKALSSTFTFRVDAYGNPLARIPLATGYGVADGWTVYDSAGLQNMTSMVAGPGYWVKVNRPVTLYNIGLYPPRPGANPEVYGAGQQWNLMGYTDAAWSIPVKSVADYFGASVIGYNTPGPSAIYQYTGSYSIPSSMAIGRGYWVAYNVAGGRLITP